jgi:CHAT domain-containing protein
VARPLPAVAGRALEASLPEGETQVYEIDLAAGTVAGLAVDQRGADVAVSVEGPDGRRLAASDSHFGAWGVEPVPFIAERRGRYRLMVQPSGATERVGRYEVRLEALRPATQRDRGRVAAEALLIHGEELRRSGGRAALTAAVAAGLQALAGFRALDERGRVADTLYTLAYAAIDLDRMDDALAYDREALELFRSLRREREVGRTLDVLGQIHRAQGDTRQALALYGEALALDRRLGERAAEATTLMNLGRAYRAQGETDRAVASYRQALDLWRALGNRGREAATLASLGDLYQFLGDSREALVHLEPALAIFTAEGNEREQARTLNSMGGAYSRRGDGRKGIEVLRRALALERRLGDRRGEAVTLNDLGCAAILLGDWRGAGAYFAQGRARFQEIGDRPAEAVALANAAGAAVRLDPRGAIAAYEAALPRLAAFGDRDTEASALLGLAQGRRGAGDLAGALAAVEEGISRVESLRGTSASREIRTAFLASKQDFYSFEVDLLMERHRRAPGEGWEARALAANERARARGLLDLLAESHADLRRGATLPLPASVAEIRREALDGETLLLEYALGGSRSFLWAVTRDGLAVFELPPRREIEEVARRAYRGLSSRQTTLEAGPVREALGRLSRMLLQPAAGLLGGSRRLLVVPDGALHYIPFAALPAPGSAEPLAATHEVVSSPSASALVVERRGLAGRRPALGTLAVVADPVFDAGDPRVSGHPSAALAGSRGADRFRRLPYSRREAEALLALVPPERRLSALGFAASRETVLGGRLAGYRIVHFASHGVLDPANPDLSRLVLSQVDERGRPRDGSVRARELYALSLPADLVVLSACRTALGQEVRGEGLVGLTRGFQYAGARAVLVSLWEVDDQATAELMRLFYREMLYQGRPPAAALRTAQEALRRQERWRPPYFWAGFTLQGDWRAVPTPPSMPPGPLPGGLSRRTR